MSWGIALFGVLLSLSLILALLLLGVITMKLLEDE